MHTHQMSRGWHFTSEAINQIVDFEIAMHQHSILALLGNAGYLTGKKLLQLF
jgi:hypothetical protein